MTGRLFASLVIAVVAASAMAQTDPSNKRVIRIRLL